MVTLYVITALSNVGLPMLNSFVGEFLVLAGSMQATFAHHILWTVLGTSGVIFSAAYMLILVQRVFYGNLGPKSRTLTPPDLSAREHIALWPMVALMLLMGVISPYWMKSIDEAGTAIAHVASTFGTAPATTTQATFVDPELKAAALKELDRKDALASEGGKR
jgi:NADH-quinone oxidoreductase subunit M